MAICSVTVQYGLLHIREGITAQEMVGTDTASQWNIKLATDGEDRLVSIAWSYKGAGASLHHLSWLKLGEPQWGIFML